MNTPVKNTRAFRFVLLLAVVCYSFLSSIMVYAENAPPLTTVYKVINKDGSVSFSDQPQSNAETVMVAPVATVPAFSPLPSSTNSATSKPSELSNTNRYSSFKILAPAHDSAFYSGSGEVEIMLDVQPKLYEGDSVEIWLDGVRISSGKSLQTRIDTVARGTHSLRAKLLDRTGKLMNESAIQFTVHRPSIKR